MSEREIVKERREGRNFIKRNGDDDVSLSVSSNDKIVPFPLTTLALFSLNTLYNFSLSVEGRYLQHRADLDSIRCPSCRRQHRPEACVPR